MKRALIIFVKRPTPGHVKTRLARAIGTEAASEAYKALVSNVLDQMAHAPFEAIRIVFDPPDRESDVRLWLDSKLEPFRNRGADVTYHPQADGDLGIRLESAFAEAFRDGFDLVAAIGTDCIDITPPHLVETWTALASGSDLVFGPADDGGYYLVALSAHHPEIFREIPWSDPHTLEKSLAAAGAKGLQVTQLESLGDVDEIEDWIRVRPSLGIGADVDDDLAAS